MFESLKPAFLEMCDAVQELYNSILKEFGGVVEDKKAFAARVKQVWCAPVIFAMQKDSLSDREYFKGATIENLTHWLDKYKETK